MFFALLPPMPIESRLVLGLLGMLLAGLLTLVFRRAYIRWRQWVIASLLTPAVILAISALGLNSGQRTEYVFLGAVVGIVCVRGQKLTEPIPAFGTRAVVIFIAFALLGPAIGLLFHGLRYQSGMVELNSNYEIGLSLQDGAIASLAGCLLAGLLVATSLGSAQRSTSPMNTALPSTKSGSAEIYTT